VAMMTMWHVILVIVGDERIRRTSVGWNVERGWGIYRFPIMSPIMCFEKYSQLSQQSHFRKRIWCGLSDSEHMWWKIVQYFYAKMIFGKANLRDICIG